MSNYNCCKPKEYFECFKSDETNTKHKWLEKWSTEINNESFSNKELILL